MFITSVLLLLASFLPLQNRDDIDQARFTAYDYLDQGQLDSAMVVMNLAIKEAQRVNYKFGEAKSLFVMSYLHRMDNQLGKSFELNLKALKILELSNDPRTPETLTQVYSNTGEILINHFKYQEAVKYFDKGLQVSSENQLEERTQNLLYNRAYAFRKAKEYFKAKTDFEQCREIAIKIGDEWMILNSLNMLGKVALDFKEYEQARMYFQKVIDFEFEEESDDEYKGMVLGNIGKSYFEEGKIEQAKTAYLTAIEHNSLLEDHSQLFETQLALVELNLSANNLEQAWHFGNLAINSYEHTLLSPDNYRLFNLLNDIAFERKEYLAAQNFHRRYVEENEAFLKAQRETIQLSEQYKMELLTASFFKDIEKQEQMAQLNHIIYLLLGLGLISFVFVRAKKYLLKKSIEQAFHDIARKKNLHL